MKPTHQEKENRIRNIIEKQYINRENIIIKQTEKIMEIRLKEKLANNQQNNNSNFKNKNIK